MSLHFLWSMRVDMNMRQYNIRYILFIVQMTQWEVHTDVGKKPQNILMTSNVLKFQAQSLRDIIHRAGLKKAWRGKQEAKLCCEVPAEDPMYMCNRWGNDRGKLVKWHRFISKLTHWLLCSVSAHTPLSHNIKPTDWWSKWHWSWLQCNVPVENGSRRYLDILWSARLVCFKWHPHEYQVPGIPSKILPWRKVIDVIQFNCQWFHCSGWSV